MLIQDTLNFNRFCTASVNARISQRNYVKKQTRRVTEMLHVDMKDSLVHIKPGIPKKELISSGLNYNELGILKLIQLSVT